jgi:hypothetical protein
VAVLGVLEIVTPLFQTSFFPDFMQVNFFPDAVLTAPNLTHIPPALTAEFAVGRIARLAINTPMGRVTRCFMLSEYNQD